MVNDPRTLRTHPELRSHASFPLFQTVGEKPKSRLEKLLSVSADVRSGEGIGALLMTINVFILLAAYYLLKTGRDALILTKSGPEAKVYWSAAQAFLLFFIMGGYSWIASKVNRFALVAGSLVFFGSNLVLFVFLGKANVRLDIVFFLWVGIFNVFVISQFWAFANDIYTEGQGRRLFPLIGVGSSLGAWWGAAAASGVVGRYGWTPFDLMMAAVVLLSVSFVLVWIISDREKKSGVPEVAALAEEKLGKEGGFELIRRDRYLMWIAVLTVLLNVVNTNGEYILDRVITTEAFARFGDADAAENARRQFVGSYKGGFFAWVNLLGFVFQAGAVSRLMRYGGVRGSLFVLPCISLSSYAMILGAPVLGIVKIGKILENSTDYSLQNTVKEALWLPTSREAKYKAKAAVDTFFKRIGDASAAGIVLAGSAMSASARMFALFNVVLAAVWLWVAWQIKIEHRRRTV